MLDVPSLGAHFYISNLHKWLCTPKGSAFLWVAASEQSNVLPLVTSHGYGLVRSLQLRSCTLTAAAFLLWQCKSTTVLAWLAVGPGRSLPQRCPQKGAW